MKHEICDSWILGGLMIVAYANGSMLTICAGMAIAIVATLVAMK